MPRDDNFTTFIRGCFEIWEAEPPGTVRACPGIDLLFCNVPMSNWIKVNQFIRINCLRFQNKFRTLCSYSLCPFVLFKKYSENYCLKMKTEHIMWLSVRPAVT